MKDQRLQQKNCGRLALENLVVSAMDRAGDNEVKAKEEEFRHDIIEKLGLRSSESEYDGGNSSDYINDYKRNKLTNPKYCIVGDSSLFITYNR